MRETDIIAIVNNGLLRIALRHIVRSIRPNGTIGFSESITECEEGKVCPKYLIIESALLSEQVELSLANIKSKNPKGKILLIENKAINSDLSIYATENIKISDSEAILKDKLNEFFIEEETKPSNSDNIISEREKEIVKFVALGKTNKEISDALFISPHTVITHRKNITSKLGIRTIAGLTIYAILNGLINPDEAS